MGKRGRREREGREKKVEGDGEETYKFSVRSDTSPTQGGFGKMPPKIPHRSLSIWNSIPYLKRFQKIKLKLVK